MRKMPCDIYSRVTGYYQPVRLWNPGKKSEFRDRFSDRFTERVRINLKRKKQSAV